MSNRLNRLSGITTSREKQTIDFGKLVLLIAGLLFAFSSIAQNQEHLLVRTPQSISVRRTLPANVLPYGAAMPANFSANPTDEEIYRVHFFEEPLVPMKTIAALPEENIDLVYALSGYSQRKSQDDFSSILNFLKRYPNSRWKGALLTDLGLVYRRTGYYNQAMASWQQAWALMKQETNDKVKPLADRVISELLLIYGWTGRVEKLEALLNEIDKRSIQGPAVARIGAMRMSLWMMKHEPGISFKCGPYALNQLYSLKDSAHRFSKVIMNAQSPATGFSLLSLKALAKQAGLDYQMAFRQPGADIIPSAVVHWKLDHYSALLKSDSGYIECQDVTIGTTYGQQFWLTLAALDSSASGYFLVPSGALPQGWRHVSEAEGNTIFGKGNVQDDPGKHLSDCDLQTECQSCQSGKGMAQSNVHLEAVSLHIYDVPLFYTPPKGPAVNFKVDYHQQETFQTANFNSSNLGQKWTFQWLSYVVDNPNNHSENVSLYGMGGGLRTFVYNYQTKGFDPEIQSDDVLVRLCDNCYELRHTDGSKQVYARPDGEMSAGRRIYLTQIVDAAGNAATLSYDDLLRVSALTDALGQVTVFSYDDAADNYRITKVTDPFGRSARFAYDDSGKLQTITDMIGMISSFHYIAGDFANQMTTPYGTTNFTTIGGTNRSVETDFPMGEKERVQFVYKSDSIFPYAGNLPNITTDNGFLEYRNTFFWDKKAMQEAPGEYHKAKIYHWLHGNAATDENNYTSPQLESIKEPLESRVVFDYDGQQNYHSSAVQGMSAQPTRIGQVLDDGTSQITSFSYNILGKVTHSIDPAGRSLTYTYDTSNINLLEVRQTTNGANELLAQYTYNGQYLPLTAKDASGQMTRFTYNDAGQILTAVNPRGEKSTFTYDESGYLKTLMGPVAGTTYSFTYDAYGRVRTVSDPEGYTVTTDYDAFNRPTIITYPDSTFEQIVYDRLDAVQTRDRLGRWAQTTYDSLDRPYKIQDALGRITQLVWCSCGSLAQIIDPLNHVTTFTHDLEGRLTAKTYQDGKTVAYAYGTLTSRLKAVTDAKGQQTLYSYYIDNNLKQVNYAHAVVPTGSVSFTYDPSYNRVATMFDTTGTTTYGYHPIETLPMLGAGQLATVDGPLNNDLIAYSYDSLGRVNGRTINGVASSVVYDALGRMTSANNALGSFGYSYVNQTDRLAAIKMPNGLSTVFDYFDNKGDQRLNEILNQASGHVVSKFDYAYNAEGQITKWTQQSGTASAVSYVFSYDLADQLLSSVQQVDNSPLTFKKYAYQYDSAENRTLEQIDNDITFSDYNGLNQLVKRHDAEPSRSNPSLPGFPVIGTYPGNAGTDSLFNSPPTTTPPFTVHVDTSHANDTLAYDANGNLVSSMGAIYGWDALDRLVSITNGSNLTEFVYDGLSRRVAEKLNGVVIKRFLWDGTDIAEERDPEGGTVTKRFFAQGEQIGGKSYYFFLDHLGSVREMVDSSGVVQARYDYDPYGRRIKVAGSLEADFGFTGHYYHAGSGLYLTLYRAYDAKLGRWLNRDPIEEDGGLNLYAYVEGNPVNLTDPYGLVAAPTIIESIIPVYGSGKQLLYDLGCGNNKSAAVDAVFLVLDIALIEVGGTTIFKGIIEVGVKGLAKDGAEVITKEFIENGISLVEKDGSSTITMIGSEVKPLGTPRYYLLNAVENPKLKNIVDDLYREGAQIGNGSSMDAFRLEQLTGGKVGGKTHTIKLLDYRTGLQKIWRNRVNLSAGDRQIVKQLLGDIQNALSGY